MERDEEYKSVEVKYGLSDYWRHVFEVGFCRITPTYSFLLSQVVPNR